MANNDVNIPVVNVENVADIITKIENARQKPALAQIEATSKSNDNEFEFAKTKEKNKQSKWNIALFIGVLTIVPLVIFSLVLILDEKNQALGIGMFSSILTGVFGFIAGNGNCNNK